MASSTQKLIFAVIILVASTTCFSESGNRYSSDSSEGTPWGTTLVPSMHSQNSNSKSNSGRPSSPPLASRIWTENARFFTSTHALATSKTFSPINVGVYTKFGSVVASLDEKIMSTTETFFDLAAVDLEDDQELWDSKGRATLTEAFLICRVTEKASIADSFKRGVTLGIIGGGLVDVTSVDSNMSWQWEFRESLGEEETKRCPVGPIPKHTREEEIRRHCQKCEGKVRPTLKKDVEARMSNYAYLINAPVCNSDNDCQEEKGTMYDKWHVGRCVLTKDANQNLISECRRRSKIGGACPGTNSSKLFEYRCDKGLTCKKIKEGAGWLSLSGYDYDKYECRDPKRPDLTESR